MAGLRAVCGDFFRQMETDIIVGKAGPRLNMKMKKGFGGRIWSFSKTDENERFNSSIIKLLSGGNNLTFGTDSTVSRQKCILTTNHVPQLGFVNDAVTRRMLIINFPSLSGEVVSSTELHPSEVSQPSFNRTSLTHLSLQAFQRR